MGGYQPLYIKGMTTGLVQNRENFILPDDAYPILENAFIFREGIKRKQGFQFLGRLRRLLQNLTLMNTAASPWSFNIYTTLVPPLVVGPTALIEGAAFLLAGTVTFTDNGNGGFTTNTPGNSGTINYTTGDVVLTHTVGPGQTAAMQLNYFPDLPVMGLPSRELNSINNEELVAFDQTYAYRFNSSIGGFEEFLPGTTWTGSDSEFFWGTNYWVGDGNIKIFWVTNFSGSGDPIRYTNGIALSNWVNFTPQINNAGDLLNQCLVLLPFRGRLIAFNTREAGGSPFPQRIRWAAIGNPFTMVSPIVSVVNPNAWRDDIRGQGGFLDIPTSESIVSAGFVRDNVVVYCERSTWQLRYTGRSIAPFQIERVNSELGSESTFSAVQFDTSLVGIGDKGIIECDSYKSERIDIKIPDLTFQFNNDDNGTKRVHGVRDFFNKLAFWTYPFKPNDDQSITPNKFPDRRLVYNYENDSWAILHYIRHLSKPKFQNMG